MKRLFSKFAAKVIILILCAMAIAFAVGACVNKVKQPVCNDTTTDVLCIFCEDYDDYLQEPEDYGWNE